ncbi:MAG: hypothetical protein IPL79_20310 [Myxococcales bacterium]|nr:hypothetical protein [Myxococcales bacterium]
MSEDAELNAIADARAGDREIPATPADLVAGKGHVTRRVPPIRMPRDRHWVEYNQIADPSRMQRDTNNIAGEPRENYMRHTAPGDRSGELWLPGPSKYAAKQAG